VKKVLIKDQHTFEAWYRLPQIPGVRTLSHLVAPTSQYANHIKNLITARFTMRSCGAETPLYPELTRRSQIQVLFQMADPSKTQESGNKRIFEITYEDRGLNPSCKVTEGRMPKWA